MDEIRNYFPEFSSKQYEQLDQLTEIYEEWNAKINVISRKDMIHFRERHVLHSLGIQKFAGFEKGSNILDIGTGGGFPGVPLAIANPECNFTLLDSIGKKLKVIEEVKHQLNLKNITTIHSRVEDHDGHYNYIVSRAVTNMPSFMKLTRHLSTKENKTFKGLFYLKGGDFNDELRKVKMKFKIYDLNKSFEAAFFETKKVIELRY